MPTGEVIVDAEMPDSPGGMTYADALAAAKKLFPEPVEAVMHAELYLTFWTLSYQDLYVPEKL